MKKLFLASLVGNGVLLFIVIVFAVLFATHAIIFAPKPTPAVKAASVTTAMVNKSWDLPATSSAKAAVFTLVITKAEKTDKIVSDGKSYTTKNHRSFLIVNTVVENKGAAGITIGPSDFIKLLIDGKEVDALYKSLSSTVAANKSYDSSMVFLIDENAKSVTLSIGTNVKKTTTLPLSF